MDNPLKNLFGFIIAFNIPCLVKSSVLHIKRIGLFSFLINAPQYPRNIVCLLPIFLFFFFREVNYCQYYPSNNYIVLGILANIGQDTHYRANIAPISRQYRANIAPISRQYRANIAPISRQYRDNIATISRQYRDNIATISRQYRDNIATISRQYCLLLGKFTIGFVK